MRSHFTPILTYLVSGFSLTGCYWNDDGTTLPVSLNSTSSTVECIEACITSNPGYIYAGTQQVSGLIISISLYYIIWSFKEHECKSVWVEIPYKHTKAWIQMNTLIFKVTFFMPVTLTPSITRKTPITTTSEQFQKFYQKRVETELNSIMIITYVSLWFNRQDIYYMYHFVRKQLITIQSCEFVCFIRRNCVFAICYYPLFCCKCNHNCI